MAKLLYFTPTSPDGFIADLDKSLETVSTPKTRLEREGWISWANAVLAME